MRLLTVFLMICGLAACGADGEPTAPAAPPVAAN
jgi:predicted small lipoprotein YifL